MKHPATLRPTIQRNPFFSVVLLLVFLSPWGALQAATPDQQEELLQFTAAGHVMGFKTDGLYVASGDHVLHVGFVGTDGVKPQVPETAKQDGKAPPLSKVAYTNLWPGVDLRYEAAEGGIAESTWVVDAGTDADQIRLRYNAPVEIEENGSLKISYETGWMRESAPIAWQKIDGQRKPVEVAFRLVEEADHEPVIGFEVGRHDSAYPLLIDPTLEWNTFLGSPNDDTARTIAVDGSGNIYVAGTSWGTWGSPVNGHNGHTDAFVAKLNGSGVLQWHTFMGSGNVDIGNAISVDGIGNVYVAGSSRATWGSPVNGHGGNDWDDAFVAKLNGSGVRQWNTFLGSSSGDAGVAIAVDGSGNVYVAGNSSSATWGSPVKPHAGGGDAFAAKLNSNGVLQWNTFMGSSGTDSGSAIALDRGGNVYVAGASQSTWGSPVNPHTGYWDVFAAKLNPSGVLQWNTFMGSSGSDDVSAIAVDDSGNVYMAGISYAIWGAPVNPYAGDIDAFVAKLNSSGERQWNTFMGSSVRDYGNAIAVDGSGNVYVAGSSQATWGAPVNPHTGYWDAFAAKLNSNGVLQWNTFMGSSDYDVGSAIALDRGGNVYVAGYSWAASWGTPVNTHSGGHDAFVAKLHEPLDGIPLLENEEDASKWGWKYDGIESHEESIAFQFQDNGYDRHFHVTPYDVDQADELCLYLNDVLVECLAQGPDNEHAAPQIVTLPAGGQLIGKNMVEIRQKTPGWRWGVTNVGLYDNPGHALLLNEEDPNKWGWNYEGIWSPKEGVTFQFESNGFDHYLHVTAYDVDQVDELCVYVNDFLTECLSKGPNESHTAPQVVMLPISNQIMGANLVEIRQKTPSNKWGVTKVGLYDDPGISLLVNEEDPSKWGWNFEGIKSHKESIVFQFQDNGFDRQLHVTGYDIDNKTELCVYLNESLVECLAKGKNNKHTAPQIIALPSGYQVIGTNLLEIREKKPGWKWGVTNVGLHDVQ